MSGPALSLYTPSIQDPVVLEQLFVGRADIVQRIVDDVVRSVTTKAKHHHLIVGPRGIGKTHLLSIVFHRLEALAVPGARYAWLREDPWGMRNMDHLLLAIARAVAHSAGAPELERGVDERPSEFLGRVAGDGTIVLLAENLNEVFRRIGLEGQRQLRAFIQNESKLVIVGTTPSLFDAVTQHEGPFYGTLPTTKLDEFTVDEAQELLVKVANMRGDHKLAEAIGSKLGRQRLKVIQHLAGGHPRLWMLFADSISLSSLDELVPLFLKVLDDLTPYYQARMQELEDQQEEIVFYFCQERGARTVKQLAKACGLAPNAASAQLGKLAEKGYVRKVEWKGLKTKVDKRTVYYELREPLMRLCLDVKESRGEPIKLIVEFLAHWYSTTDLARFSFVAESSSSAFDYALAALTGQVAPSKLEMTGGEFDELIGQFFKLFRNEEHVAAKKIADEVWPRLIAGLGPEHAVTVNFAVALGALNFTLNVFDAAAELLAAALDKISVLGLKVPNDNMLNLLAILSRSYCEMGALDLAISSRARGIAFSAEVFGHDHLETVVMRGRLGELLLSHGRVGEFLKCVSEYNEAKFGAEAFLAFLSSQPEKISNEVLDWYRAHDPSSLVSLAILSVGQGDDENALGVLNRWRAILPGSDDDIGIQIALACATFRTNADERLLLALPTAERQVAGNLLERAPLSSEVSNLGGP